MNRLLIFRICLGTILAILLAVWGGTTLDAYGLEEDPENLAVDKVNEFERHSTVPQGELTGYEVCATITVAREYVVWGRAIGKISVWTRVQGANGNEYFGGVEFHYILVEGTWINTDSVALHTQEAREPARDAFEHPEVD